MSEYTTLKASGSCYRNHSYHIAFIHILVVGRSSSAGRNVQQAWQIADFVLMVLEVDVEPL